ncbi:fibrinogen-like protein 1-like protein isoform X2 [Chrysemys picta bellii]
MMALLCVAPVQGNGALAHKKVERGFPKDCSNIPRDSPSGVHVIQPAGSPPRVVWCDMDTEGKGWTVVQRNSYNTEITWKESWSTYKYGFGNVQQDYWLGNEYLSLLTRQNIYKVRFVVEDKSNNTRYAEYDIFSVEGEPSGYPLRLGRYSGDSEDYLTTYHSGLGGIHDNMKFSTSDKDQDQTSGNCASSYGGWWYDKCQNVLLNGKGYIYIYLSCLLTRNIQSPASPNTAGTNSRDYPPCSQLQASLASTWPKSSLRSSHDHTMLTGSARLSCSASVSWLHCPACLFHTRTSSERYSVASSAHLGLVSGHMPSWLVLQEAPLPVASSCLK